MAEAEGRRRLPDDVVDVVLQLIDDGCRVKDADKVLLGLAGGFEVPIAACGGAPVDLKISVLFETLRSKLEISPLLRGRKIEALSSRNHMHQFRSLD